MDNKSKNKTIIIVLSVAVAVVAISALIVGLYMINEKPAASSGSDYNKYIEIADKYAKKENYSSAIQNYWAAIELNYTEVKPYEELGQIYETLNDDKTALSIYQLGFNRTNSLALYDRVQRLSSVVIPGKEDSSEPKSASLDNQNNVTISFNESFCESIAVFTFSDFNKAYGKPNISLSGDVYAVSYPTLPISFNYYNTESDQNVIDASARQPGTLKRPVEIIFNDLSYLFIGMKDSMNYNDLSGFSLKSLNKYRDTKLSKNIISFVVNGAKVIIECDASGNFTKSSWNRIYPASYTSIEAKKDTHTINGSIINAVTGSGVSGAAVKIKNATTGETYDTVSSASGQFTLENLPAGDYSIRISGAGFITEDFTVTVFDGEDVSNFEFTISPALAAGEIRFVLSWNASPRDLDSYLDGISYNNRGVSVNYMHKNEYDEDGSLLANLDIDDMDGYGPETTTLYDVNGSYTFTVRDYGHTGMLGMFGANVKIYVGSQAPISLDCPAEALNEWCVCAINKDNIQILDSIG